MAWASSKIFKPFLNSAFTNAHAWNLTTDSFKAALFDSDITPDNDVAIASSAFGSGVWTTSGASGAEEVYEAGTWPTGGVALAGLSLNIATADIVFWDANDTASSAGADLANVHGCLVYDTTITSYGICYNWFGGANSVTNGTFTIVWNANGIFRITL